MDGSLSKDKDTAKVKKPWYKELHWQIVIGMVLGLIYGISICAFGSGDKALVKFTTDWIKPWGIIFISLLKLIAMPMIIASLVCGVASLSNLTKLSRIGGKTIGLYLITTVFAIIIGLTIVNVAKPGKSIPQETRKQLMETYTAKVKNSQNTAEAAKQSGPLQVIVNIVPQNAVKAASDNGKMLQMVFLAMIIGVGLVQSDKKKTKTLSDIFEGVNEVILRVVDMIMKIAPFGVFAQISTVIVELGGSDPAQAMKILQALGYYVIIVILGMFLHMFLVYGGIVKFFTKLNVKRFFKTIQPVQLIAFSTSSSSATLPVTMETCEKELDVPEEIAAFTLPVGATINMDGTSLYQAVSAVFIAQILGMDLSLGQQLTIVVTATLASIGTAGVPGAGVVMLVIILQSINVPVEGIALILGVERILDMFRTVTNVTGDAAVTNVIAGTEKDNSAKTEVDNNTEK